MIAEQNEEQRLTTGQTARLLGVARDTVWDWIEKGVQTPLGTVRLRARKLGGRFRVSRADIAAFEAQCNGEEPPRPVPSAADRRRSDEDTAWLDRRLNRKRRAPQREAEAG